MAKGEKPPQRDGGRPPVDKSLLASASAAAAVGIPAQLQVNAHLAMQQQSGPIPPPEILRKYDEIHPGLAKRIIKMAEEKAAHRRIVEREVTAIQARDQTAYRRSELPGQVFGFATGLAAIGGAALAAVKGVQIAASFIGTAGVTGLVTAFMMGRHALLKLKQEDFRQQQILQQQLAASSQSAPG